MLFKVGDQVVHPRHGIGKVTRLVIKQFAQEEKRPFYEIFFQDCTIWVPSALSSSTIRKMTGKSEIANCRQVLMAPAMQLNTDPRLRQVELTEHLKTGSLTARCEVVRDLTAYSWKKSLSEKNASFLQNTQDVLCQEWAAVEGIAVSEAAEEIESLLEKGKKAKRNG